MQRSLMIATAAVWTFCAAALCGAAEDGFQPLFDGKTLQGWTGATDSYEVSNGVLICKQDGRGNLMTEKEYSDFVLRFSFRLTPGANNGVAVRSPLKAEGSLHLDGIELQILDDSAEKYRDLKPYQYHGSVYGVVAAEQGHLKPVGEWNDQEVTCQGSRIKVVLNGHTIVDADLVEASRDGTLDGSEHPGLLRERGHLGFLGHGDYVEFRDIRLKELAR